MNKTSLRFERDELIGIFISLVVVSAIFGAMRFHVIEQWFTSMTSADPLISADDVVAISSTDDVGNLARVLRDTFTATGVVTKIVVEDEREGTGPTVEDGSRVTVHYVGMLQDGTQFDNSYSRGEPYTFMVGAGEVIEGWEKGLLGAREGGERLLVIPPEYAYGSRSVGPVPADATLLFAVEIIKVE